MQIRFRSKHLPLGSFHRWDCFTELKSDVIKYDHTNIPTRDVLTNTSSSSRKLIANNVLLWKAPFIVLIYTSTNPYIYKCLKGKWLISFKKQLLKLEIIYLWMNFDGSKNLIVFGRCLKFVWPYSDLVSLKLGLFGRSLFICIIFKTVNAQQSIHYVLIFWNVS